MAWTILVLALLGLLGHIAPQQTAFITDLPAFSSLALCAAVGLSDEAKFFTAAMCTQALIAPDLASCVCLVRDNSAQATRGISFFASVNCPSSTSSDASVSAALNVLTDYCRPAENAAAATTTGTSPAGFPASVTSTSHLE